MVWSVWWKWANSIDQKERGAKSSALFSCLDASGKTVGIRAKIWYTTFILFYGEGRRDPWNFGCWR
jgi:hypothetical protein